LIAEAEQRQGRLRLLGLAAVLLVAVAAFGLAILAGIGREPSSPGPASAGRPPERVRGSFAATGREAPQATPDPARGWLQGDPAARHDDTVRYRLPFEASTSRLLLQGVAGSFSHGGPYTFSFDFKMPVGTLVLAARSGLVVRVIDGFAQGGPAPSLRDRANLVTIRHADGTFGEYVHLSQHGALVREGQEVDTGQPIAHSGATGFTSEPHLHFMVWKATADGRFETVPIRFDDGTAEGFQPRQGLWYGDAMARAP
jgi:murein DD-endopeptidase MepM/ murein hydrolase activator NlpD